ncbi:MAG TPA: hypothetical protein DCZ12_04150 [Gammaproteobacteria bacterium]|nr:hypothetical protein [Gammaproteobacteria bacterium]
MNNIISGGPLTGKAAWALIPFIGDRAHYWRAVPDSRVAFIHAGERVQVWKSLCGQSATTYKGVGLLDPGNWPRCLRCERARKKQVSEGSSLQKLRSAAEKLPF